MDDKLRQIQLCQLEILKEIVRICDKNEIDYWLAYGTMLGAVRHQGFIPWDDDLDIYMTMEGFQKFQKCCKTDLNAKYFLQTPKTEPMSAWIFYKLRKNGTLMLERGQSTEPECGHRGIWVNIFPLINAADSERRRSAQIVLLRKLQTLRTRHLLIREKKTFKEYIKLVLDSLISLYEHLLWRIVIFLGGKRSRYKFAIENQFNSYKNVRYIERTLFRSELFLSSAQYFFEDDYFNGVADYDGYLSHYYSENYMTPTQYPGHAADYSGVIV